jgi:hypothetical protein
VFFNAMEIAGFAYNRMGDTGQLTGTVTIVPKEDDKLRLVVPLDQVSFLVETADEMIKVVKQGPSVAG